MMHRLAAAVLAAALLAGCSSSTPPAEGRTPAVCLNALDQAETVMQTMNDALQLTATQSWSAAAVKVRTATDQIAGYKTLADACRS